MELKIDNLNLSVRAYNCLKRAGIQTVEEMLQTDLARIRNCGIKTINEIEGAIEELLKEKDSSGTYAKYLINNKQKEFVDGLELSIRAKNVLKRLEITNANMLLRLDKRTINSSKNAGKMTVYEIIKYINTNREQLISKAISDDTSPINIMIDPEFPLCGKLSVHKLEISLRLKEFLNEKGIYNIKQLLLKKITPDSSIVNEYNAVYDYFYNIVFSPLKLQITQELRNTFVEIPFNTYKFKKGELYLVNDIINEAIAEYTTMNLKGKINFKLYLYWLNTFNITDLQSYLFNELALTEKQIDVVCKRLYRTLEEVGDEYGITRERVRQIEAKTAKVVIRKYSTIPFKVLNPYKIYYLNECTRLEKLLLYVDLASSQKFTLVQEQDVRYFLPKYYIEYVKNIIESNKEALKRDGYIKCDEYTQLDEFIKSVDYLDLNFNNKFISRKIPKRMQVKYAMRYLKKPISISNDTDLDLLIETVKYIYGTELEPGRALEGLINDVGVRVDSGSYSSDDSVIPLIPETLQDIKNYIKERKIINTRDLFVKFGEVLNSHNLKNESILYRYLKEELYNELYFGGVSCVISSDPNLTSWGDVVIKTIRDTGKPISKSELILKHSVTEAVYNNLSVNFRDIIVWGQKELYLKSMIDVPQEFVEKLTDIICEKQVVSFENVKAIINSLDDRILMNNNVNSNENLYYFLVNILNDTFVVDKVYQEVRYKVKRKLTIEKKYLETEELTI